jgi:uncharacterized damage-inducible protein DinB
MTNRYIMFAGYNASANERIYETAGKLSDADYRADRGAFFKSVQGTLNHLLVADRIWMRRFTGNGPSPTRLDEIPFEDFSDLRDARRAEDKRIVDYIAGLSDNDLAGLFRYRTIVNPADIEQPLSPALDHFFNHQAHHRGQLHCLLSGFLGNDATPSLDLIIFQRESGMVTSKKVG